MSGPLRSKASALTAVVLLTALAGCTGTSESPSTATSSPAAASSPAQFTSRVFSLPLTVTLPASLMPEPSEDTKNLISWNAVSGSGGMRFLLPIVVYHPDSTTPAPLPKDYPAYLRGLVDAGGTLADESRTTVAGHATILLTGTTSRALDGTLGCPAPTTPREVCFGLQPDLVLRIAIIDLGGRTLLAWARSPQGDSGAPQFFTDFEAMIHSLKLT
ncbi:hypothetical protein [Kribbella monticola]|uniref:hypothetical protein n=1 Tax=Kribbella monticola TaxID=2185285 RepID=UPI000DD4381C|nr:hypothetical protein [Kribbella monticola]